MNEAVTTLLECLTAMTNVEHVRLVDMNEQSAPKKIACLLASLDSGGDGYVIGDT